ncbi:DFP-domain-containing protein [Neocallimastix lanati (nom. inval.)]|jgi:phosphopantothenate-cysteine ligase|uniref:DFP-domain-containing protein n=1 Tax=Neocallimastix californiae TaxID=1754190 RepID=A0A1Y2DMD9_9FUNG|nr:DFP-domain-containing protein [Neocallimastix sp. JGI-2020a]ORY60453.1 DFP-domain-containing protein [Neocallimastix californiae]|eukprot:ORY60453.1 DFP-domain-containing protein [Neocallimastix californiae]
MEVDGEDDYFVKNTPPSNIDEVEKKTKEFLKYQVEKGRRIVLVTSGGTTVPLENQTVRFVDNFSAGTRGSSSAEYFIEKGYAVIFLYRQHSLRPYSRHYSHSKNCFLDMLDIDNDNIIVNDKYKNSMKSILEKYKKTKRENLLLEIDFFTVKDYFFYLNKITKILSTVEEKAMYYLAAAVSDFFIPPERMVEHKIQSGEGALKLSLDQVPKFLKPLVSEWAPKGFIVSFKLETDPSLLISKARKALKRYGHQIVIGNMLLTRKKVVHFITNDEERKIEMSDEELSQGLEIETKIISELIKKHDEWIEQSKQN